MHRESPIGIFDSGVGGITVFKQVRKLLPGEDIVYFGDTGRAPYGIRPQAQIRGFVEEILDFMASFNIKLGLVACNTITVLGLDSFTKRGFDLVGVSFGAKSALTASKNKHIGVMGTPVTISSGKHKAAITALDKEAQVYDKACPRLAGLIETGNLNSAELRDAVAEYLEPLKKGQVDTIILACTHYPFVAPLISELMGNDVTIIDPAVETAKIMYDKLAAEQMLNTKKNAYSHFYFSGDVKKAVAIADLLINTKECSFEEKVLG